MLLTRSRLCPRPKPGSSLHLHVLGTPPAFVLSQDQTLREELLNFTKESSGVQPADLTARHLVVPPAAGNLWACPWWDQTLASIGTARPKTGGVELTYTESSGRKTGSILAPPSKQIRKADQSDGGVEPGHTPRSRDRPRGAHAVEFSKTVAPLQEGGSFLVGHPRTCRLSERTGKYSAETVSRKPRRESTSYRPTEHSRPRLRPLYDSTWTVTTRLRGRSSKSIRTSCCQVPSASSPPTTGIVSDGPMIAARMWAWEFVSWLRRLCS